MQVLETTPSLDIVLAHNALLNTECERLLDVVRQQQREIAGLRGQDADQAELELLLSLQKLEVQQQMADLVGERRVQRQSVLVGALEAGAGSKVGQPGVDGDRWLTALDGSVVEAQTEAGSLG